MRKVGWWMVCVAGIGVVISLWWWAFFYSKVTHGGQPPIECLFNSGGACGFIAGMGNLFVGGAYSPTLLWVSIILAVAGGIAVFVSSAENAEGGRLNKWVAESAKNWSAWSDDHGAVRTDLGFDAKKWEALLKYDPEISSTADAIRPLGPKWMTEFGRAYMVLNDKSYLASIARRIVADADDEERSAQQKEKAPSKGS